VTAATVPARQDSAQPAETVPGRIRIADTVVAKLAARAAVELDGVGAAAPRLLGHSLDGVRPDRLGGRRTTLAGVPKAEATVDGDTAFLSLTVSMRWPLPVVDIAERLRSHVSGRVEQLTGLTVGEVDITVDALVAELPQLRKVR
jgi:uncharacterized alkaline shock family protein YloU